MKWIETEHYKVVRAYDYVLHEINCISYSDSIREALDEYVSLVDKQIEELNKHRAYLEEQIKAKDKAIYRVLDELDYHERMHDYAIATDCVRALIDATSTDKT